MPASAEGRARRYVELSNAHDLDAIEAMFHEDATYQSANVGEHEGREAILVMMRAFFAHNPNIRWDVDAYREIDDGGVEFDFTARAGGGERRGTERIYFDDAGRIRRVEVEA